MTFIEELKSFGITVTSESPDKTWWKSFTNPMGYETKTERYDILMALRPFDSDTAVFIYHDEDSNTLELFRKRDPRTKGKKLSDRVKISRGLVPHVGRKNAATS